MKNSKNNQGKLYLRSVTVYHIKTTAMSITFLYYFFSYWRDLNVNKNIF